MSEQAGPSTSKEQQQRIQDLLQEVVDADPEEFVNLAIALDLDEKEMEEEARLRLTEEGHLNLAVQQDEESIRLMKQALLLEKLLSNYENCQDCESWVFSQKPRAYQQPDSGLHYWVRHPRRCDMINIIIEFFIIIDL